MNDNPKKPESVNCHTVSTMLLQVFTVKAILIEPGTPLAPRYGRPVHAATENGPVEAARPLKDQSAMDCNQN